MTKKSFFIFPGDTVFILTPHGKLRTNKKDALSYKTEDGWI